MNSEWIRFGITCFLLVAALVGFTAAVIGAYRFGFVMNRLHAAGIGDTLGIFFVILAVIVSSGTFLEAAKAFLIIVFLWFTSPASSHFLSQIEYFTNPHLYRHVDREI